MPMRVGAAAEALLPEAMAQDDDAVAALLFLVGWWKNRPTSRLHAEHREDAGAEAAAR